jgi:SAM-dependent methyltransferase
MKIRHHATRARPQRRRSPLTWGVGSAARRACSPQPTATASKGVDLTLAAVAAAIALSERTGLGERTRFLEADALSLPFPDAAFDHAWTQFAAMDIPDRARFYAEIARVLKPGGRLAINDVVAGGSGPLEFPVPSAPTPDSSFLLSPDAMRDALTAAGFEIVSWEDTTDVTLAAMGAPRGGDTGGAPRVSWTVVLAGPEYPRMVETFLRNLREGRAGVVQAVAARR